MILVPTYDTNGKVLAFHKVNRDKNFNSSPFDQGRGGGGGGDVTSVIFK